MSLEYHTRIRFKVLRETEKALLIKPSYIESRFAIDFINSYGPEVMKPIEMWIPKSWLKSHDEEHVWIWKKGLMINLEKLAKKRLLSIENNEEKNFKFNAVIAKKFEESDIIKIEKELDDYMDL